MKNLANLIVFLGIFLTPPAVSAEPASPEGSPDRGAGAALEPVHAPVPAPPRPPWADAGTPPAVTRLVLALAPQYGLDPRLVLAVIAAESSFRVDAVSPRNARGLMQLMPDTAARFGVTDPFDPVQNLRGGMTYLRWLLSFFRGDVSLALAAYNAGEGSVERYRGVPPFRETQAYLRKVRRLYPAETHPFEADLAEASRVFDGPEVAELEE